MISFVLKSLTMLNNSSKIFGTAAFWFLLQSHFHYVSLSPSPSVIIVGSGAAGIAAASKLLQNNITNITILEAEGRIGGRIYSVNFGDAVIDLGAQWCHGEKDNIVYEMVKELNLLRPGDFRFNFYNSSREQADRAFLDELSQIYWDIYEGNEQEDGITLADYLTKNYKETIFEKYGNDLNKIKVANEMLHTFSKGILSLEGAFSLHDVSAKMDYETCEGNHDLSWKGRGYKTILEILMKKYTDLKEQLPIEKKIFFNREVINVVWDNDDNHPYVTVSCQDGTYFNADIVIFTPSLGVLKSAHKTLFSPPLPKEKVDVITTLGIAAVFKVFLHFPERWWPKENITDFTFIWSEEDKRNLGEEFPNGPIKNGVSWLSNLMSVHVEDEENPNVLSVWFVGEFIPEIEKLSDDLITDGIIFTLDRFLGQEFPNIPKPDSIMRNNWYTNPHFRGTYSFQTVKSRQLGESPEVILSKPLTSRYGRQTLLFAGEATNPVHYSTVHGAIETGFREAQRIVDSLK